MLQAMFELSPFLAGFLFGLLGALRLGQRIPHRAIGMGNSIAIGCFCSSLAGELLHGWLSALASLTVDVGAAALGWVTARFVLKCIAARWEGMHLSKY